MTQKIAPTASKQVPLLKAFDALNALDDDAAQLLLVKLIDSLPLERLRRIAITAHERVVFLEAEAARKREAEQADKSHDEIELQPKEPSATATRGGGVS